MGDPSNLRALRRAQVIAAGRRIVAEQGLEALTFGNLEAALGHSRGVITWHFRNKHDVLQAILEDAIAEIDAQALVAVRSEAALADRARAVVREMVQGYASDAGRVLLAFVGRAPAEGVHPALFARYRRYSRELVRIGQQRGELRADVDGDAVAAVIVALVIGIAVQALAQGVRPAVSWVVTAGDVVARYLEEGVP